MGFLFTLTVGVWPAGATISGVVVTKPGENQVLAGSYGSDGSPSGFVKPLSGRATTNCSSGFERVSFRVTSTSPSYSNTFNVPAPNNDGTYTFNANWDTSDLRNGVYTVSLGVFEPPDGVLNTCGQGNYFDPTPAKLANPSKTPTWDGSPSAASDGSAKVTFSWKKNSEPDIVEYHITRSGPGGDREIVVGASNPGTGCSLSGTTYSCTDPASNFPDPYGGTYSYSITAMRSRPAFNSGETVKNCVANDNPCVESASSDTKQVTLVDPTPTPTPSPSESPSPGTTPTPGGKPTIGIGTPGPGIGSGSGSNRGTSVLGFGGSNPSFGGSNPFYSGSYDQRLPYTPKSLIVGDGTASSGGQNVQAGSVSAEAPNYRTVMLPVAGGLLAFLSAAHVRRLLLHF